MAKRMSRYGFDEKYGDAGSPKGPSKLPEGVEHGSARAAMRFSCTCEKCNQRRARMRARRNGVRL